MIDSHPPSPTKLSGQDLPPWLLSLAREIARTCVRPGTYHIEIIDATQRPWAGLRYDLHGRDPASSPLPTRSIHPER